MHKRWDNRWAEKIKRLQIFQDRRREYDKNGKYKNVNARRETSARMQIGTKMNIETVQKQD